MLPRKEPRLKRMYFVVDTIHGFQRNAYQLLGKHAWEILRCVLVFACLMLIRLCSVILASLAMKQDNVFPMWGSRSPYVLVLIV